MSTTNRRQNKNAFRRRVLLLATGLIFGWIQARTATDHNRLRLTRKDEQYLIKVLFAQKLQSQADGLAVYRLEDGGQSLTVIWQYAPDRRSDDYKITSFNQIRDPELFQQLDSGDCQDRSIARSSGGVLLPAIICPIFYGGQFIGAISAFYGELYPLPPLDRDKVRDPDGRLLYRAGNQVAGDD